MKDFVQFTISNLCYKISIFSVFVRYIWSDRLAGSRCSCWKLVWPRKKRFDYGNLEFSHICWEHCRCKYFRYEYFGSILVSIKSVTQLHNLMHVMHFPIYILGAFVDTDWGLSFIVPGIIIIVFGIIMWLFLVPRPEGMYVIQ